MAQQSTLDAAIDRSVETFERALPQLGAADFGVDAAAYRDALSLQRFQSSHWSGTVTVDMAISPDTADLCGRFAAYTRLPPESGKVRLVLCPQFFTPGAEALRELTILHEMVHVVAGRDECQAMAYAARIQQIAHGAFTPVTAYWQANDCPDGRYSLPD